MTLAITGAAGFIGSRLAHALAPLCSRGELVLVDHPLAPEKATNLNGLAEYALLDHRAFLREFEHQPQRYSTIFHLGACSSTVASDWDYLAENNLRYSQRLWEGCARAGTRLIYASSAATYGDGTQGFDDETPLCRFKPLNLYGKSKHAFDLWVAEQGRAGQPMPAQSVGLKFFNVWGPGEHHKGCMASVAFHAFHQIQAAGRVNLYQSHHPAWPDGGQQRDFIYVGDVVQTMLDLWARPHISGLFNLGTGRAATFAHYTSAMFQALGLEPRIHYIPLPANLRSHYQYFTQATMSKLRHAGLPFQPTPLQTAMNEYASFLCTSPSHGAVPLPSTR